MRRDLIIKSGNLAATSDFRVVAPIKKGLVPSLDTMTYKTRVKRVLRGLHGGRAGGFEYELARVLSDAVERVGVIHSVGIAVIEPEDNVLLTATFDGAWESYVRVIWQKVSRLLDLVFCNTEDYVIGYENSYEKWGEWLKRSQSEAYFLYATPDLTVDDTRYLRMQERVHRREAGDAADSRVTGIKIPTAEDIARQSIFGKGGGAIGTDPTNAGFGEPLKKQYAGRPPFRQGVQSLVGLYRLADVFPPGTKDGEILHRAARELLPEFLDMAGDGVYQTGILRALKRFPEPMRWLLQNPYPEPEVRLGLPLDPPAEQPLNEPENVQGGILNQYLDVHHACLLLLGFEGPAALAAFLDALPFTSEADELQPGQIAYNISFTVEGLRVAGLSDSEVCTLPDEFVQGMERRAGLLGDLRINHPRRWRLPALNWHLGVDAPDLAEGDPAPRIDLSAVHAVIQIRRQAPHEHTKESKAHLMAAMEELVASHPGVTPLSLQWMKRQRNSADEVEEHFGFIDGTSSPELNKSKAGKRYSNQVNLGEILCGYPNLADKIGDYAKPADKTGDDVDADFIRSLLHDGSFLAIRKLRQDVEALDEALTAAQAQAADTGQAVTREDFMAKMMGRWPGGHPKAGQPLAVVFGQPTKDSNDFHFEADKNGELCPFHAHIRRANPRIRNPEAGSRPPRFVRRGMSYGPHRVRRWRDEQTLKDSLAQERGLIFMAYNANLGEQFELVQRWLNGANSSGSYSGQGDPLFGVAEAGRRRYFRFEHEGQTIRMALDGSDRLHDEPRPFVRLEWGTYLFAPSRKALASLQERAAVQGGKREVLWSADEGEKEIAQLRDIEARLGEAEAFTAWKTVLEDPDAASDFTTASIWAAIRERHGGVLRTPFGVMVAERSMVEEMLRNRNLSVLGYLPRMHQSFGEIYLGLDAGQDGAYERDSAACNDAIMALDQQATFKQARESTRTALQALVDDAIRYATLDGESSWDLMVDIRELVDSLLADFCEEWYGLTQKDNLFSRSGYRWDWQPGQPPTYPGHFQAPSRYFFQPHPGQKVKEIGEAHGLAVRSATLELLRSRGDQIKASIARAILDSEPGKDLDFAARTLVGAVVGFVPTVNGNIMRVLNEWLREGTLWSLRARLGGTKAADFLDACNRLGADFIPAMQLRTAPELLWRTATVAHTMGEGPHQVTVNPGDIVVAGAISAAQQNLQEGRLDLYPAFGGNRRAKGHPTHACPGADPALAVMLGFFSALVESPLPLRASPAPLTLALDGRLPPPSDAFNLQVRATVSPQQAYGLKLEAANRKRLNAAATTPLLAIGDSWLFDQWDREFGVVRANLTKSLLKLGYKDKASGTSEITSAGRLLSDMAKAAFLRDVTNYLADEPGIKAILVGAGCNDLVLVLPGLLKPLSEGDAPLDEGKVSGFIDGMMFTYYDTVIKTLIANSEIPLLIHGYDYPIPDGSWDMVLIDPSGPWLQPYFKLHGYDVINNRHHLTLASEVMRSLIDRLNDTIKKVVAAYPNRAHYVKLTGTLASNLAAPDQYRLLWANELHPTEHGFDLLAAQVAKQLRALKVR
jgi:Dyp-type peroxidase family